MSISMAKPVNRKKKEYVTVEDLKEALKGYVTIERFDSAMASIALSFDRADNRLTQIATAIMNELQGMRADHREFKKTLADHDGHIIRHERQIDDLTERTEFLEKKII